MTSNSGPEPMISRQAAPGVVSDQRVGKQIAVAVERARHGNADMLKAAPALVLDGAVKTGRDDFQNRGHAAISVLSGM